MLQFLNKKQKKNNIHSLSLNLCDLKFKKDIKLENNLNIDS